MHARRCFTFRSSRLLLGAASALVLSAFAGVALAQNVSTDDLLDQPPMTSAVSVKSNTTPQRVIMSTYSARPEAAPTRETYAPPASQTITAGAVLPTDAPVSAQQAMGMKAGTQAKAVQVPSPIAAPVQQAAYTPQPVPPAVQQAMPGTASLPVTNVSAPAMPPEGMTTPESALPLSLSSMILFALADNPDVRMAIAREEQADANVGKAKSKFLPLIDFVAEGGKSFDEPSAGVESGNGNTVWTRRMALNGTQLVYDFDKAQLALDQQKQLVGSAKLDTQVNVEETMNRTIESYLQMLQFQSTLKSGSEFVSRMRALNETVNQTYEAGATSKTTLDYANSRMASAETELNTIKANINDAKSNLEYLTGPLPGFSAVAPDDLDPARLDLRKYLELAESQNTGVQLSTSDLEALKTKVDIAKSAYYPTFNFVFSAEDKFNDGGRTKEQDQVKALLQMSYRLYDGGSRKHDMRLARAQVKESEINQEKILKELRRQIRQSYNQILSIQESRSQTLKEIASSDALQQLNRENFKMGSINIIELIEGEERLNSAHGKLHQLNSDLYLNVYRLLITSGFMKQNFFCDLCGGKPVETASR